MVVVGMFTITPGVHPDNGGGYQPDSFRELLHHEIQLPGLDRAWSHTLIDVTVADDRASAQLVVHSAQELAMNLDHGLSVVTAQPKAHVRAHDADGNLLAEVKLDAPLQPGQLVTARGDLYRVGPDVTYPYRAPTGCCARGSLDWQHVTLVPDPRPAHEPTATAG